MDVRQAAGAYDAISNIAQGVIPDGSATTTEPDASFADMVTQALGNASQLGDKAEKISALALMGKADLTELATAVSSAETALQTIVTIRDKAISAYQQIMQMPM